MEGAIPHGLETIEGPKVKKARGSHPEEAEVTLVQPLPLSVMLQNPTPTSISNLPKSNDRAEPVPSRRERQAPMLLPPTHRQGTLKLCFLFFDKPASPLPINIKIN